MPNPGRFINLFSGSGSSASGGSSPPAPPVNTVAPAVTGTETVGETLSCTEGTWTGDATIVFAYQWYQSPSTAISGATASTYLLDAADEGETIFCRVTATNDVGSDDADSNTTGAIAAGGPPAWVLSGAVLDLDFVNDRYYNGDVVDLTTIVSVTRASTSYAETAAGTLTSFANNVLRRTDKGLLIEAAATNVVLHNRDLTNAAWTKTNTTAAKDQTGPDGVTNSASSLTATAGNGTALQAITLGSSSRNTSAYIKRITGSGTVEMTMNNGTTWTAVTVTAGWTRVTIPQATLANPTVGFRIVTSGDAVAIDFVQNETTVATSPIATTTASVTRPADVVVYTASKAIFTPAEGTYYGDVTAALNATIQRTIFSDDTTHTFMLQCWKTFQQNVAQRAEVAAVNSSAAGKAVGAYVAAAHSLSVNGSAIATGTATAATIQATDCWLGSNSGVATFLNSHMKRFAFFNTKLADATMQSLST